MLPQRIKTMFSAADGAVTLVNRQKLMEQPFFITPNAPNVAIPMNASQASAIIICPVSGQGPAEIEWLALQRTGVCMAQLSIVDGDTPCGLSNLPVHADTIFGTGAQPYHLPQALYLDENRSLYVTFADLTAVANAARPVWHSARYIRQLYDATLKIIRNRLDQRQYVSLPYFYTFDQQVITLNAGGVGQATISIGTDHWFELIQISGVQTGAYTLNITDLATGESVYDVFGGTVGAPIQVHNALTVGTANFPYKFREGRIFAPGTKLAVDLTDLSGAPNTIFLTLAGKRLASRMWRS